MFTFCSFAFGAKDGVLFPVLGDGEVVVDGEGDLAEVLAGGEVVEDEFKLLIELIPKSHFHDASHAPVSHLRLFLI